MPDKTRATLELQPKLDEVARLDTWFAELCLRAAVLPRIAADMRLCLQEAATNIVSYAGLTDGVIRCTVVAEPTRVTVELRDTGHPFNPLDAPEAQAMEGLATAQIGGFGIKLMRETSKEISYRFESGQNVLTMVCA